MTMTEEEKEIKQAMAYAIDYCRCNIDSIMDITTDEVWQEWCRDCEEAS